MDTSKLASLKIVITNPKEIAARDLRDEIEINGGPWEAAKWTGSANTIYGVFWPAIGRAGICLGGDSEWTDACSLGHALALVLAGETVN